MKTITPEEFKKLYGTMGLSQFSSKSTQKGDNAYTKLSNKIGDYSANAISEQFKGGISQAKEGYNKARNAENVGDLLGGSLNLAMGGISAALSPLTAPLFGKPISKAVETVDKYNPVNDIPAYQKFAASPAGEATSAGLEATSNLAGIAGTVAGFKGGVPKVGEMASNIKTGIGDAVTGAKNAVVDTVGGAKNAYESVKNNAGSYPNKLIDKVTTGKIGQQAQTMLKESSVEKFDRYVKAGTEAIKDPRALTPLEQAGETANRVAGNIKEDLGNIGKQKAASLASVADTRLPNIATKQINKVKSLLQGKLTAAERALVNDYLDELQSLGNKPTAGSVDASIDKLQATLFEKSKGMSIPTTTRIKSFINQSIRELNNELKGVVDSKLGNKTYSDLNSAYRTKVQIFNVLNKALGEEGTRGGSLLKRFFSPQNGGVKKLFQAIKDQYGVDLAQDATIARFVMDTLGDTRAKSLLQLPPTTPIGIANRALNYLEEKLTSPEKVIQKARTMTNPAEKL